MTFERFSELWNALITNNPRLKNRDKSTLTSETRFSDKTLNALIEYGQGNTKQFDELLKS